MSARMSLEGARTGPFASVALAVLACACTAGSQPAPRPANPLSASQPAAPPDVFARLRAPAAPVSRPWSERARHALSFKVAIESSCSQSWDLTTHTGEFSLVLRQEQAEAELRVAAESRGPGYHHGRGAEPQVCRWRGRAHHVGERVQLELTSVPTAQRRPYQCAIEDHQQRTELDRFTLECRRPPADGQPKRSLACTTPGPAPWLLSLTREGGAIPLGPPGHVHLDVMEGDSVLGELVLPGVSP